jgi:hypothetical protein
MRALTVQQPWAWAIFNGKVIENRTAVWSYRGPLAIHAGKQWSDHGATDPRVIEQYCATADLDPAYEKVVRKHGLSREADGMRFGFGAIIGCVDLVDVHPDAGCCKPWGESGYTESSGRDRRRITHLVLENAGRLAEPIECRGALGLWTPPQEIIDHLAERCGQCNNPRSWGVGCCTNDGNRPHCFPGDDAQ